jgi:hypothetical protein
MILFRSCYKTPEIFGNIAEYLPYAYYADRKVDVPRIDKKIGKVGREI